MTDDRYSEDEIRVVFERAAAMQQAAPPADGLTLAEMADIGEASGIPRALVEAAARQVRMGAPAAERTRLGPVPVGVRRTVFLAEPPSDALWAHLVADARRTFDAGGQLQSAGVGHTWRNGNLRMTLDPAEGGSRLELRTDRRRNTVGLFAASLSQLFVAAMMVMTSAGAGELGPPVWVMAAFFTLFGTGIAATTVLRQRAWAETRERQMAEIAERAAALSTETLTAETERLGDAAPAPRLDLDALGLDDVPEDGDAPETTAPRRRTRS